MPVQRNVRPGATCSQRTSTPRSRSSFRCSSGKSSPTVATTWTGVKKLAEYEKNVAEPPSASCTLPKGVSTLSSATEPTTSRSATALFPLLRFRRREVLPEQEVESATSGQREGRRLGDHCVGEELRAAAGARSGDHRDHPAQDLLGRGHVLQEVPDHRLDRHGLVALVPDIVVGDQRQRGVAELGLARELG